MNGRPTLTGYAATFWAVTKTPKLGSYHRIAPGAFADSIRTDEILACWKHDWCLELASNRGAGSSLTLTENSRGLTFEIRPYEDRKWIDSAIAEIRDGRVRGMSPAYQIVDYRDDLLGSGQLVRTVLRANLLEISPVCFPNGLETRVHLVEPPAVSQRIERDVIRMGPAPMLRPRRHVRIGMVVNC